MFFIASSWYSPALFGRAIFVVLIILFGVFVLSACGQKGALYLPDDYDKPTYTRGVNKSFDAVETIVQDAFDKVLFRNSDATVDNPTDANSQAVVEPETAQ